MRRRMLILFAILAAPSLAAGPAETGDLSRLQGRWEASVGRRGEIAVALEFKGSEVFATIAPKVGPKVKATGEVELDEAATPRALDWVRFSTLEGSEVPQVQSIYRIEGDKLVLRSGGFNNPRPRSFEKGGEGLWSEPIVFTRAAPAKAEGDEGR